MINELSPAIITDGLIEVISNGDVADIERCSEVD